VLSPSAASNRNPVTLKTAATGFF